MTASKKEPEDERRSSAWAAEVMGAEAIARSERIQSLWSGYGEIRRLWLRGSDVPSVILKHVRAAGLGSDKTNHPRGWNTDHSHQRKLRSYQNEICWYRDWSDRCHDYCRIPRCLGIHEASSEIMILLEDLDACGFADRKSRLGISEVRICLRWLAHFHATFMGDAPTGLWPVGTYWHLDTRPEEWRAMPDGELKELAPIIDMRLNACPIKTIVHGDAKVANFCFAADDRDVAVVDFQYAGGGCGMKDVAYFLGSCLNEEECQREEEPLLDFYFSELHGALDQTDCDVDRVALEQQWRDLYPVAWADFTRFLLGWCPDHPKLHDYSNRMVQRTARSLA